MSDTADRRGLCLTVKRKCWDCDGRGFIPVAAVVERDHGSDVAHGHPRFEHKETAFLALCPCVEATP